MEKFGDLIDDFDEPTGGCAVSLWHDAPFVKLRWRAECERGGVLMDRDLVE